MMTAVFMTEGGERAISMAYSTEIQKELSGKMDFAPFIKNEKHLMMHKEQMVDVRYIFSTWGMLCLTKEQIAEFFPALKAVFYAAGTVQSFARPFLESGIEVFSAWTANAVPVAEYSVAQIVLANKGFYQSSQMYKKRGWDDALEYADSFSGNYSASVGLLGAGAIGKVVIKMLKNYNLQVMVFDPFLSEEKAEEYGVVKADLETIFSNCTVISNHLANNEQTVGMLDYKLFSKMRKNATFINTGRGAQVVESDLVRALTEERARTAVLDVTFSEPPEKGHEFYRMDNVIITPHIAGSKADEIMRMGEFMTDEFLAFNAGNKTKFGVTLKMLETMA